MIQKQLLRSCCLARGLAFVLILLLLPTYGCSSDSVTEYRIQSKYAVSDPQFVQTMGNLLGPPLIPGNRIETLRNGDEIFPAMLAAIRSAKKTISFETYIYWSGTIGQEFSDAFVERTKAGVKIHVMIDWLGSSKISQKYVDEMKAAGVEVQRYHPIRFYDLGSIGRVDHRTHRKLLVVDGVLGFTGGVGIADEWRGHADNPNHWRDNHYRVQGPIVAQLQAAFLDNWVKTTGEVLHSGDYFPALTPQGNSAAQIFKSSATGGSESMQLMFVLSITATRKTLRMESAYFVPDDLTQRSLIEACNRGVKVQLIVPGPKIDEKLVRHASRARWGDLLKAGVEIYEYQPTMFHCKLFIADDLWCSVGSSNLDNRSFRLNDEANLNVLSNEFAAKQIDIFEEDKSRAQQITYEQWTHRPIGEKFLESLASVLGHEL